MSSFGLRPILALRRCTHQKLIDRRQDIAVLGQNSDSAEKASTSRLARVLPLEC
jgi:hypothetical protein